MKTLDEIDSSITQLSNSVEHIESRIDLETISGTSSCEHYIAESGSYYLTKNLMVEKDYGIYVAAPNVTIDLNGFMIGRESGTGENGIYFASDKFHGKIINGSIRFFSTGIYSASKCEFENLTISRCSLYGIRMPSEGYCKVKNCRLIDNPGTGIESSYACLIQDCWIEGSGGNGIYAGPGSQVKNCLIRNSSKTGLSCRSDSTVKNCISTGNTLGGISVLNDSLVSECVSKGNGSAGITISYGSCLSRCTSAGNGGNGIYSTGSGCLIEKCVVQNNTDYGIFLQENSTIKDCIINANKGLYGIYLNNRSKLQNCCVSYNESDQYMSGGVNIGQNSTIQECVVWGNSNTGSSAGGIKGLGILLNKGSMAMDCSVSQNQGDGIRAMDNCQVIGNQLHYNGLYGAVSAGIYIINGGTRAEDNLVTSTDYGILTSSSTATNLVVGNSVSGSSITNYLFYGMVLGGTTVTNTGTISSKQVWDNFEF
jgi:hypothetical protein